MQTFLTGLSIFSSVGIILTVLLQNQGSGLGDAFGGGSNVYRSKRGLEKGLFGLTIFLAIMLVASILVRLIIA